VTEAGRPGPAGAPDNAETTGRHKRQRQCFNVQFETDGRDNPAGRGRAEIRAENDSNRAGQ